MRSRGQVAEEDVGQDVGVITSGKFGRREDENRLQAWRCESCCKPVRLIGKRTGARVVERARLESV